MRNTRIPGHTLPFEGRVYIGESLVGHGNGPGRARCSCGEMSPEVLPSTNARKQWHREHKEAVSGDA
jgi:hypothetical protein